ncbi:PIN domain-containing protein [Streptomyces scabiei]|uniref:PIN domain-containing protein n=1 Tax=Streptomyces scabiei TaxID=1930 RepID=UPI000765B020|nr:PIN domain-containing protein [Streptomyces scabiei]MDX2999207.1 PIN domain-containing protein [Streptomyces scabiei]MDX3052629.1 PIN domain-containing protein [Streptomyces scabiei]
MLITPRPGADRKNIRQVLGGVHVAAMNLQKPYDSAYDALLAYLEWATESARMLRPQISDRDLDTLILTDRYRVLLASCGTLAGTAQTRLVNRLVQLEVAERIEALEAAVYTLDTWIGRWNQREVFVVADSSFYIQNEVKLADVDIHEILDVPRREYVRLLFPIVVVDELDDLKDASKARPRWRAAHTLGLLDGVLNGHEHGVLREGKRVPAEGETYGRVNVEIVLDPPGHVRLDRPDVEIIDRTVAIQGLAGREVRLLTCDTSQHTRGRAAGLKVTKVATKDPGEEPDWETLNKPGNGTRAKRRARQAEAEAEAGAEEPGGN